MKKEIFSFLILALYILGAIGGFGYACYSGAYLIAIAVVALAVMAWPTAWKCIKDLFM
jgi:uncharacterized membrane protein